MDAYEIIDRIKNSPKVTKVKVYLNDEFESKYLYKHVMIGNYDDIKKELDEHNVSDYLIEYESKNAALPLMNYDSTNARIEYGAIIRDGCSIGDGAVILMGAVLNTGCEIGKRTMIDMNAVLGGRVIVGENCHIGAGCVLAGVIEPASAKSVVIEDNVFIGANAVVLEGVRIGKNSIVAAGSVVTHDIMPNVVVAGTPARVIKDNNTSTAQKVKIVDELRGE